MHDENIDVSPTSLATDLAAVGAQSRQITCQTMLDDHVAQELGAFLRAHPRIRFTYWGFGHEPDLDFLRHFEGLSDFELIAYTCASLDPIAYVAPTLRFLRLSLHKPKVYSVQVLTECTSLRSLFLEVTPKNIEPLASLSELGVLYLRSITIKDPIALMSLRKLWWLWIGLGGTRQLDVLADLPKLRYLELWMIKGLEDLSWLSGCSPLEELKLESLANLKRLPDCKQLEMLRVARLYNLKRLTDISGLASGPNLTELYASELAAMSPSAFRAFVGKPSLRSITTGLRTQKLSREAAALFSLPPFEEYNSLRDPGFVWSGGPEPPPYPWR
jgi:hypothetical protein